VVERLAKGLSVEAADLVELHHMKRLIVCSDGTWNNPDQEDNGLPSPTNVFKIYNAIAENDGDVE